jgi:hypothetical protein
VILAARAPRSAQTHPALPRPGKGRAQRIHHRPVDLVAARADRRPDRGPEPFHADPGLRDERRDEPAGDPAHGPAPPRMRHAERRTLGVGDDERHAVGGEDRQRPPPLPREEGIPGADQSPSIQRVRVEADVAMDLPRVPDVSRLEAKGGEGWPRPVTPEGSGGRRNGVEAPLMARREGVSDAGRRERRQHGVRRRFPVPAHHRSISTGRP